MNFLTQLVWEFRLQKRYYFFVTAMIITVVWILLLITLNDEVKSRWLPVLIFADLSNIGLLFIAGCLYLERRQGTLYAIAITPVRRGQWLVLKLLSLSALTSACAVLIVGFSGVSVDWLQLLPAILVTAALFTLCGFLVALPFDDILNYFVLMALSLTVLGLPLFDYFDVYAHWLFWALPSQPVLNLLVAGFQPLTLEAYALNLALASVWIAALYSFSQHQFRRFIAVRPQA